MVVATRRTSSSQSTPLWKPPIGVRWAIAVACQAPLTMTEWNGAEARGETRTGADLIDFFRAQVAAESWMCPWPTPDRCRLPVSPRRVPTGNSLVLTGAGPTLSRRGSGRGSGGVAAPVDRLAV